MKKVTFFLLAILSIFVFSSCGDDGTTTSDKCKDVTCDEWKSCQATTGNCVLTNGRCDLNSDCTIEGQICNTANHTCEATNPECTIDSDCTDTSKPICENGVCVEENVNPECT
ncbi:hypothetical protein JXR93_09390, partial [bacterium]|nr:hypothetical protein [bacterium]